MFRKISLIIRSLGLSLIVLVFMGCSGSLELSGTHSIEKGSDNVGTSVPHEASTLPQIGHGTVNNGQQEPQAPQVPSDTPVKTPPTPQVEPQVTPKTIHQPVVEFMGEFNRSTPEQKRELLRTHIDAASSEGKDVKICFHYDPADYAPGVHKCDQAQFLVFLNVDKSKANLENARLAEPGWLNLNNLGERPHIGISGKTYKVPNLLLPTERQQYKVPGTMYTARWGKDGKINITIACTLPASVGCHDGIASMAVFGKIVVKNGGTSSEVTFVDRRTQIVTGISTVYDATEHDFELITGNPSFDDWCQIVK